MYPSVTKKIPSPSKQSLFSPQSYQGRAPAANHSAQFTTTRLYAPLRTQDGPCSACLVRLEQVHLLEAPVLCVHPDQRVGVQVPDRYPRSHGRVMRRLSLLVWPWTHRRHFSRVLLRRCGPTGPGWCALLLLLVLL